MRKQARQSASEQTYPVPHSYRFYRGVTW